MNFMEFSDCGFFTYKSPTKSLISIIVFLKKYEKSISVKNGPKTNLVVSSPAVAFQHVVFSLE